MGKRGGVHAREYVLHIPVEEKKFDRALCGRRNVNFFGNSAEWKRDIESNGTACCRQCRKKFEGK